MMTSISKLNVAQEFPSMSSREVGTEALNRALLELTNVEVLELDFASQRLTPSFADQCIGGLATHLGLVEFKRRVKIMHPAEADVPLLRHVILQRASRSNS